MSLAASRFCLDLHSVIDYKLELKRKQALSMLKLLLLGYFTTTGNETEEMWFFLFVPYNNLPYSKIKNVPSYFPIFYKLSFTYCI